MDAAAAHGTYLRTRYFEPLDALRFLAISLVVWHHMPLSPEGALGVPLEGWALARRGFLGIDIFFLLSGYLIVTLFLRERDKAGTASLTQLFTRRALRLFPLYYGLLAAFAFYLGVVRPDGNMRAPFFHALPYYLTFTSNWVELTGFISTYWTLATQEQFYLAWPVVEKFARRWAVPVAVVALVLSELANFRLTAPLEDLVGLRYERLAVLQVTFAPIFMGVLLAHLLHGGAGFRRAWPVLGHRWMSLAMLLVAGLAVALPSHSMTGLPRLAYQLGISLALASAVARPDHLLRRAARWPPVVRIGQLCYGIFLFHMVTLWALEKAWERFGLHRGWLLFATNYALAYLLAEASYRWFETPFLELRGRFRGRLGGRSQAPTATSS